VDGAADGAADVVQLKRARGSRGSRAGAFRGWQSEQRWKWLVTAATIPQLGAPTISELKRNSAAVAFTSAYSPKTGDDSQFGFVVRFEAVEDAGDAGETAFDAVDVYSGKNFTFADDTVARAARPTVAGLGAGTAYRFKVRVFYGDAFGSWSAYSEIATTPTRGAPAQPPPPVVRRDPTQLAISHAFDDGGAAVAGVGVRWRRDDDVKVDASLVWHNLGSHLVKPGSDKTIIDAFTSLLPSDEGKDHSYLFEVKAYNNLGISTWSEPSEPLRFTAPIKHRVLGRGAIVKPAAHHLGDEEEGAAKGKEWHAVRAELDALFHDFHAAASHGPIVAVRSHESRAEDTLEVWAHGKFGVNLQQPRLILPAWQSHWSPTHYDVAAELVIADPVDAATPLANAGAAKLRVLLVERGGVPFVVKAKHAQDAGALAVVVVDGGVCTQLDQYCVPGAMRAHNEGFAKLDLARPWLQIHIPVVLILASDAERMLANHPTTNGNVTRPVAIDDTPAAESAPAADTAADAASTADPASAADAASATDAGLPTDPALPADGAAHVEL